MRVEIGLTAAEMLKVNEVLAKLGLKDWLKGEGKGMVQDTPAIKVEVSPLNFSLPFKAVVEYKPEFTTALMNIVVKNATPLKMLIQSGIAFLTSMMAVCGDLGEDLKQVGADFGLHKNEQEEEKESA